MSFANRHGAAMHAGSRYWRAASADRPCTPVRPGMYMHSVGPVAEGISHIVDAVGLRSMRGPNRSPPLCSTHPATTAREAITVA